MAALALIVGVLVCLATLVQATREDPRLFQIGVQPPLNPDEHNRVNQFLLVFVLASIVAGIGFWAGGWDKLILFFFR